MIFKGSDRHCMVVELRMCIVEKVFRIHLRHKKRKVDIQNHPFELSGFENRFFKN